MVSNVQGSLGNTVCADALVVSKLQIYSKFWNQDVTVNDNKYKPQVILIPSYMLCRRSCADANNFEFDTPFISSQ